MFFSQQNGMGGLWFITKQVRGSSGNASWAKYITIYREQSAASSDHAGTEISRLRQFDLLRKPDSVVFRAGKLERACTTKVS